MLARLNTCRSFAIAIFMASALGCTKQTETPGVPAAASASSVAARGSAQAKPNHLLPRVDCNKFSDAGIESGEKVRCYVRGLLSYFPPIANDFNRSSELKAFYVLSMNPRGISPNDFTDQELANFYYDMLDWERIVGPGHLKDRLSRNSNLDDLAKAAFQVRAMIYRNAITGSLASVGRYHKEKGEGKTLKYLPDVPAEWMEDADLNIREFFLDYLDKPNAEWDEVACKYLRQFGIALNPYQQTLRMAASDYLKGGASPYVEPIKDDSVRSLLEIRGRSCGATASGATSK